MTLAECKAMKKGTKVRISEGRGWFREGKFLRMTEVTSFGTFTLEDLMRKDFDLGKGKKRQDALIEIIDDNGRRVQINVNPKRITI